MEENVDYKKLYHIMVNAAEEAVNRLIDAQRQCEELYLAAEEETGEKQLTNGESVL